ncbi:MAG: ABC transporter substrate-binding protein [Ruminococcaceae bacterium]|nr:ABC transporter substrate-binding protein [Oscillospiraceae bacterium]
MKKLLSLILALTLLVTALSSCSLFDTDNGGASNGDTENVKINIGVMSGPTGMGMAKLMNDNAGNEENYSFKVYSDPTIGTTDLIAKDLDMLCLPTNAAANLSKKSDVSVIAINCLGSLYLLTDSDNTITSINELEGKTIYTSVPTSTTKPIIDFILKKNNVNATIEVVSDHDSLVKMLATGEAPIAILPEPKVTAALSANKSYSVALNLSEEWSNVSDTPLTMGCIVVRNEFLNDYKSAVDKFLTEYKASIEYVGDIKNKDSAAQMIVDAGVLPKLGVAKGALGNLYGSIIYQDGAEMKASLLGFYDAIGLARPADSFYYEKK